MMHLFLNCLAASAGSGLTYVRNIVPQLSARPDLRATLTLAPQLRNGLGNPSNISFVELKIPGGAAGRFCWEQALLPRLIRQSGADVLLSAGNFALRRSPVPQMLLSGNSLYTSADFYDDLRERRAYRIWLDTRARAFFARLSVRWADCTVAPSKAFADTLRVWTGGKVVSIYHGFDPEIFFRDQSPLPSAIQNKIDSGTEYSAPYLCQPLQLLPEFRDLIASHPVYPAAFGREEGSALPDLQTFLGRKFRRLSPSNCGCAGSASLGLRIKSSSSERFHITTCSK
jgi:hypothetical protein